MAYTLTQLAALEAAYAAGLIEVQFQGRREIFATGADLAARIAAIKAEMEAVSPSTPGPVRVVKIWQDDEG